jgi:hypothetical protein
VSAEYEIGKRDQQNAESVRRIQGTPGRESGFTGAKIDAKFMSAIQFGQECQLRETSSGFFQIQFVREREERAVAISIDLNDGRRNLKE